MKITAAEMFDRHAVTVYRYFCRMTGSPDLAEDLTQDVFVRVIRGVHRFSARSGEASWLISIARNVLADRWTAMKSDVLRFADIEEPTHDAGHLMALAYDDALRLLAPSDRAVYLFKEQVGLSYSEIAKVCGVTEEAVRSRLYRARRDIRCLLSDGRLYDREETRGR